MAEDTQRFRRLFTRVHTIFEKKKIENAKNLTRRGGDHPRNSFVVREINNGKAIATAEYTLVPA
jgi:hypothetical protein